MNNNKILSMTNLGKNYVVKRLNNKTEADKLLRGFKLLSSQEKETLMIFLDALLISKRSEDKAG